MFEFQAKPFGKKRWRISGRSGFCYGGITSKSDFEHYADTTKAGALNKYRQALHKRWEALRAEMEACRLEWAGLPIDPNTIVGYENEVR